jgi:hypothetical protein
LASTPTIIVPISFVEIIVLLCPINELDAFGSFIVNDDRDGEVTELNINVSCVLGVNVTVDP